MKYGIWLVAFMLTLYLLAAHPARGQTLGTGVTNGKTATGKKKSWRVAYHKDVSHPKTRDKAIRLEVSNPSGTNLTATLTRYDDVDNMGSPTKYVRRALTDGGTVALTGQITTQGQPGKKKREEFILAGLFTPTTGVDAGHPILITIRGYHSVGRNRDNTDAGRADDQLCIRIGYKDLMGASAKFAPGDPPCDDQPPDEDVLTEEDPPNMEGEDSPYDGGP